MPNRLEVQRISSTEAFSTLRDEWNDLLSRSGSDALMLRWEWLFTWWEVYKEETTELMILTVRDMLHRLVAVAPLYLRWVRVRNFLPLVRRLLFLGTGEALEAEVVSEFLDIFCLPGMENAAAQSLFVYLNSGSIGWDEMVLSNALQDAKGVEELSRLFSSRRLYFESGFDIPCYYVTLQSTWEETFARFSQKQRYEIRRDTKKLNAVGKVELVFHDQESHFNDWWTILRKLHQERWTAAGERGVFSNEKFLEFHRRILEIAWQRRWLSLPVLLLDEKPIGALYNFVYRDRLLEYQTGIKRDVGSGIAVGNVLHSLVMKNAVDRGYREYNFLGGNYDYKRRWATGVNHRGEVRIRALGMKMGALQALRSLKAIFFG